MLAALADIAAAAPSPQGIEIPSAVLAADPVLFTPPFDVASNVPKPVATAPLEPISTPGTKIKRDALVERDGSCAPQPSGSGPVPTPDTPAAFESDPDLQALSANAVTPDGYAQVFQGANGSLSASNYMGLYTLDSYDVLTCASKCDQASGCEAFNLYLERDPSQDPNAANCPNPPSTTNFKCTLWGAPVSAAEATNTGQWRDSFQVVITGSNAYNKNSPPPAVNGFTGPQELGGAINAPLDSNGHNTYMGYQFFPFSQSQGYDPSTCAQACTLQTTYNQQHPNSDGSYQSCIFFDAYVLSENSVPQGLYCSLYNETWTPNYATNYGQYRGSDRYTVSRSYSYSLNAGTTTSSSSSVSSSPSPTSSASSTSSSISSTFTVSSTSSSSSSISGPPSCPSSPGNLVQNGGFECGNGLYEWTYGNVQNTFITTTIGDNSNTAFEFLQEGAVAQSSYANPAYLTQWLYGLNLSKNYQVTFRLYFDKCTGSEGFVGVRFPNNQGSFTYDACDFGGAAVGKYATASFTFTAGAPAEQIRFEFIVGEPNAVIRLDNIVVSAL